MNRIIKIAMILILGAIKTHSNIKPHLIKIHYLTVVGISLKGLNDMNAVDTI